jgi:hypothetical protein
VWVTIGGVRKWVASPTVMADCGYRGGDVDAVPAGLLNPLPALEPVTGCRGDGSIVVHGDGKAHLVRGGWKRHIPNPATFEAMGLSWYGSAPVADGWIPTGHQLLDAAATGRLVRQPGAQVPVYVMDAGAKRHIADPAAFLACGYGWDSLSIISETTIASFPAGPSVTGPPCPRASYPNGVLMAGSDGKVWVLKSNTRHYVTTAEAFTTCGYRWPDLNLVPDSLITALGRGADVTVGACP